MKPQSPQAKLLAEKRKALQEKGLVRTACYTKPEDKDRLKRYVKSTLKGEIGS